jgi:hypothetical protein
MAQLSIVTSVERLDDLTPKLASEFQVVASVRPTQPILELPDVVVKAGSAFLSPKIAKV